MDHEISDLLSFKPKEKLFDVKYKSVHMDEVLDKDIRIKDWTYVDSFRNKDQICACILFEFLSMPGNKVLMTSAKAIKDKLNDLKEIKLAHPEEKDFSIICKICKIGDYYKFLPSNRSGK